jgi:hypothetical protein
MPLKEDHSVAGVFTDQLIKEEVDIQARMWGDTNECADTTKNQLIKAALAQLTLLIEKFEQEHRIALVDHPLSPIGADRRAQLSAVLLDDVRRHCYPEDWDGFRDYGSNIANLVVAAAFIRNEIKRRVILDEDTTRTKRGEPYKGASPYVSAEQAAAEQYRD